MTVFGDPSCGVCGVSLLLLQRWHEYDSAADGMVRNTAQLRRYRSPNSPRRSVYVAHLASFPRPIGHSSIIFVLGHVVRYADGKCRQDNRQTVNSGADCPAKADSLILRQFAMSLTVQPNGPIINTNVF